MPNTIIHIFSNIIIVGTIFLFYKYLLKKDFDYKNALILMLASNIIDIDHLLATPIYDPNRCGINFHTFHSWYMFPIYFIGLFFKKYMFFSIGIIIHLILDWLDCLI